MGLFHYCERTNWLPLPLYNLLLEEKEIMLLYPPKEYEMCVSLPVVIIQSLIKADYAYIKSTFYK